MFSRPCRFLPDKPSGHVSSSDFQTLFEFAFSGIRIRGCFVFGISYCSDLGDLLLFVSPKRGAGAVVGVGIVRGGGGSAN